MKKLLVKNIVTRWGSYFIAAVISFFMLPFVVHKLGNPVYGVWVLIGSLTGYLGLLDLGIGVGLVKYISEYISKKDNASLSRIISNSFFLYGAAGGISLIASVVLMVIFPLIFPTASMNGETIRVLIAIVGVQIALGFPLGVFGGILKGRNRYDLDAIANVATLVVRTIMLILLLNAGYGIVTVAIILLFSNLFGYALRAFFSRSFLKALSLNIFTVDKEGLRKIFNYSSLVFISGLAIKLLFYTDSIVIGAFLSATAITIYSIGGRLIEYLREFVAIAANVFMPIVSGSEAAGLRDKHKAILIIGTKFCWAIVLFSGTMLIAVGKPFISLWMGPGYTVSYTVLTILLIAEFIAVSQSVSGAILYGLARHKMCAIINSVNAIINLLLSIILVRKYGILGVAWGTTIPYSMSSIVLLVYSCKVVRQPISQYIKKAFFPPLIGAIPFLVYCYYIYDMEISSLFKLMVVFLGAAGLYLGGVILTSRSDIRIIIDIFKRPKEARRSA